ncbi:MAG: UDP-N-acetylglucosamine 2-epimerase (non-hydrolyzing) [Thermoleophilia bacterium]|nr:UDP-N-acetylglucosamine 2-epimerase (non-hydrolyzing) [Thermoleophilia bacterium]
MRLLHVVGTRPNFMKAAAVMAAVNRWNRAAPDGPLDGPGLSRPRFHQVLVHTGQHYDEKMSRVFFDDLALPRPDHYLEVGSGSHAEQTARVMLALEPVLEKEAPDLVMTVGDVNSTLAAALVAAKLDIPVAHVEAGLRSRDRTMPEELNRLVVDQLSDLLFTTSRDADDNLAAEGIPAEKAHFVGNTMIDTLKRHLSRALESSILARLGLAPGGYAAVTLHRPSNVDEREGLKRLVKMLGEVARRLPVVFPVHARTRQRLGEFGFDVRLRQNSSIILSDPLGYLDFLCLMANARLVLTDSGGIQEETTVLSVPCLTLRKNTERPVTITEGTNRLVDPENVEEIVAAVDETLVAPMPTERCPEYWDGHAGDRIVQAIADWKMGPAS